MAPVHPIAGPLGGYLGVGERFADAVKVGLQGGLALRAGPQLRGDLVGGLSILAQLRVEPLSLGGDRVRGIPEGRDRPAHYRQAELLGGDHPLELCDGCSAPLSLLRGTIADEALGARSSAWS